MNRTRIRSMAGIALLAIMTAFASGCYYYGYDYPEYYARRNWRYDRYYDRRYDPRQSLWLALSGPLLRQPDCAGVAR